MITKTMGDVTSVASQDSPPYILSGEELPEDVLFDPAALIKELSGTPKRISPIYQYDDRGSALFERLCREPSYYLTRTERAIINKVAAALPGLIGSCILAELGAGSGEKTRPMLAEFSRTYGQITYIPIDISKSILIKNAAILSQEIQSVSVNGFVGTFSAGLGHISRLDGRKCVLFLGSTIGNMEDSEVSALLALTRDALSPQDHFLVGADLDKDSHIMEAAYNNQTVILANLNIMHHLNRRFDGNFDLFGFRHIAFHNTNASRMEAHLEATEDHEVTLARLGFSFALQQGERILTNISRKFIPGELVEYVEKQGFRSVHTWFDQDRYCALFLFRRL